VVSTCFLWYPVLVGYIVVVTSGVVRLCCRLRACHRGSDAYR
jgi:hypothetical protein